MTTKNHIHRYGNLALLQQKLVNCLPNVTAGCGTMLTNVVVLADGKEVTNVVLTFADIKELVIGWKKK